MKLGFKALALVLALLGQLSAEAAIPAEGYTFVPSAKEAELYRIIRDHPSQRRVQVVLDPRLCAAARSHARDTQRRRFFSHVNPDGVNANQRALSAGFPLPAYYPPSENYIESMAGSVADTPADAVKLWSSSSAHSNHVFGKTAFYLGQVVIGVGHAPADRWGYATYVFISAPLPDSEQSALTAAQAGLINISIDRSGVISLAEAPAAAILEVWRSDESLNDWELSRTVIAGPAGTLPIGVVSGRSGFFRFGYFQR